MMNLERIANRDERIVLDDSPVPNALVSKVRPYEQRNDPVVEALRVLVPPPTAQSQQDSYVPNEYLG